MICVICGYNFKRPIGRALKDAKKGEFVEVKLFKNGIRALSCPVGHLKNKLAAGS